MKVYVHVMINLCSGEIAGYRTNVNYGRSELNVRPAIFLYS